MRKFRIPLRAKSSVAALGIVVLLAVACTGATTPTAAPTPTPEPTAAPTAAPTPTPEPTAAATAAPSPTQAAAPTAVPVAGSGVEGGDPEFTPAAMVWQAYWLSRDHFGPLVMASGMGIPFQPPMDMMQMGMQMVTQNPNDPVMVPQNMMPLQAVYRAGSSDLLNNPMDFGPWTLRACA